MDLAYMVGSACFAVAAVAAAPSASWAVSARGVGATFFVGSIFFTTAATVQLGLAAAPVVRAGGRWARWERWWNPSSLDWMSAAVQWVGTLWFNLNTFDALPSGLSAAQEDLRVWTPDMIGSVCFLVSSQIAVWVVARRAGWRLAEHPGTPRRDRSWWVAAINLAGSVAFMVAAVAAWVQPATDDVAGAAIANAGTCVGGICFLWAARLDQTLA